MPRPSARLRRLLDVVRRRERELRPAPGRLWRSVPLRYAQFCGRCFRGVESVPILPPAAALYSSGGAARLSEDIEALRSLARFWCEVSASLWPARGGSPAGPNCATEE